MAQASAVDQHRAAPLEITPEARERLTPFLERTFRAMYAAAMADGGVDVIDSARLIFYVSPYDEEQDTLSLACWVDGKSDDANRVHWRVSVCLSELHASWSEAELADYKSMNSLCSAAPPRASP